MKMQNASDRPVRIPADFISDEGWADDGRARPTGKVTIPPGAVVELRDEVCVRSRASWSRSKDGEDGPPTVNVIDAPVTLAAPQLQPHGEAAVKMFESTFHDQLPSVIRAMEELKRKGAAERGEVLPGTARPRTY